MADLGSGKLYVPETAREVFDLMIEDFELEASKDGNTEVAVAPGTDDHWFFTAVANADFVQYGNIATIRPGITPLESEGEDLERWRRFLGVEPVGEGGSTGKIIVTVNGTSTIEDGRQLTLPNKLRLQVNGTHVGVVTGSEVSVVAIDGGKGTNAPANAPVRFVDPPLNVAVDARVAPSEPLTGGTAVETESRLRERLRNKTANAPGAGNWGQLRQMAFDALPLVQGAYIYPALGGPSNAKIVITKDIDPDPEINDFTRAPNSTATKIVRDYIQERVSGADNYFIEAPAEVSTDVTLQITIPNAITAGGDGTGWRNSAPWPTLEIADSGKVEVSAVTSSTVFTVTAQTTVSPIVGITRIAWWSPHVLEFESRLVVGVSGSSGAWVLTVDRPMVDRRGNVITAVASPIPGDFISPDAVRIEAYGTSWRDQMRTVTPGENTTDPNRLDRALRHPKMQFDKPSWINTLLSNAFEDANDEVSSVSYGYRLHASAQAIPASEESPPNIFVLRNFAVYPE